MQKQIDIAKLDYKDCGCPQKNLMFQPVTLIKRLSAIMSETGKEEIVPIDAFQCTLCGKIPDFVSEKIPGGIPDEAKPNKTNLIT